jgi:hypothetical protein
MVLGLKIGDVLQMKKPHPCGESLWTVTRLGADIGMNCQKCDRYVLLARSQVARRLKRIMPSNQVSEGEALS